jgi:hypothetical protein
MIKMLLENVDVYVCHVAQMIGVDSLIGGSQWYWRGMLFVPV